MLTLTQAGSVGTLPCLGGFTGLLACSAEGTYWQLAPRSAVGLHGGQGGNPHDEPGAALVVVLPLAEACLLWSLLARKTVHTTRPTTTTAATDPPTIASIRRRRACCARRSSCRSSLRLAVARRCSLVGTADIPPWLCAESAKSVPVDAG